MSRSNRSMVWGVRAFGALAVAILIGNPAPAHAAAIWSADAAALGIPASGGIGVIPNNFIGVAPIGGGLVLPGGNSYTFAGTFAETTTPGLFGSTATALMILNIQITAGAGNVGAISDVMGFYSDIFPGTAAPIPGFVGMAGSFSQAGGSAQAEMDFNGSLGGLPASAFLRTPVVFSPGAGVGFGTFVAAPIPVSTNELTGLLAFSLNPGETLTLPFDFSDNVSLAGLVPEPSSIVLMMLGGVIPVFIVARQRKNRSKAPAAGQSPEVEVVI